MELSREVAPPRVKHAVFALLAITTAASVVGTAFSPYLLVHHPLVLIALTPVGRHVALIAPSVALVPTLVVCTLRRVIGLSAPYGIGALYGDRALIWAEKRYPRFAAWIRFVERLFLRWGLSLVLFAPTHTVAVIAGAGGTRYATFVVVAGIGELAWTWLTYYFGELVSDWTAPMIVFISHHLVESTLLIAFLVVLQQIVSRRRGRREGN